MKKLKVSAERDYEVFVGANFQTALSSISRNHTKVLLVVPNTLAKIIKIHKFSNVQIFKVTDGESQKSLKTLEKIWTELGNKKFSRTDAIIALGGGATTDLVGYAAASWLRGISWYAIPTSLAAMVDASIGGKTAINSTKGKNLIGAFYSPSAVYIDLDFLKTLKERDLSAGMAEVIKCGFIDDKKILELVQEDVLNFEELIFRSVKVKVKVVNKDFKESKLREVLNYGHTLGHAIEKHSKYKIRHGEAVSIGLVFAAELSNVVGALPRADVEKHRKILTSFHLPTTYSKKAFAPLLDLMLSDKKVKDKKIRFIGLRKIGKPQWLEEVNAKQIKIAYERIAK